MEGCPLSKLFKKDNLHSFYQGILPVKYSIRNSEDRYIGVMPVEMVKAIFLNNFNKEYHF